MRREAPDLRIVSEAQWDAAHRRLTEARALYLRATDGKLWGQPARGTESKYLLVGLATCGVCGAGLSVRSRSHGKQRAFYYVCTAFHTRGKAVCPNRQEMPMERTNAAILGAVCEQVLSPDIAEAAIARATARLLAQPAGDDEAVTLRRDISGLDDELARLTGALATGGDLESVTTASRTREATRRRLRSRLEAVEQASTIPTLDRATIAAALRARIADWRAPLAANVAQARQILRKVLVERIVTQPDGVYSTLRATATLAPLLAAVTGSKGMASPTGTAAVCTTELAEIRVFARAA